MLDEVKKCHAFGEVWHFVRNCKKKKLDRGGKKKENKPVKCYNCGKNMVKCQTDIPPRL